VCCAEGFLSREKSRAMKSSRRVNGAKRAFGRGHIAGQRQAESHWLLPDTTPHLSNQIAFRFVQIVPDSFKAGVSVPGTKRKRKMNPRIRSARSQSAITADRYGCRDRTWSWRGSATMRWRRKWRNAGSAWWREVIKKKSFGAG